MPSLRGSKTDFNKLRSKNFSEERCQVRAGEGAHGRRRVPTQ